MSVKELDTHPLPFGELALQTIAMPKDTNANGDVLTILPSGHITISCPVWQNVTWTML